MQFTVVGMCCLPKRGSLLLADGNNDSVILFTPDGEQVCTLIDKTFHRISSGRLQFSAEEEMLYIQRGSLPASEDTRSVLALKLTITK